MPGMFAVDKPLGVSSARVVAIVKRVARQCLQERNIKVGHGGTLDPLATGVLVIAVGREYTKQLFTVVGAQKEYIAQIQLGYYSTTDDAEGEKTVGSSHVPSLEMIHRVCAQYVGIIEQVPPIFSAIKRDGVRAYTAARRGATVMLEPRPVRIDRILVEEYMYPTIILRIQCGKGTYIRALARDIGKSLGTGAYLQALRRTRVGSYRCEQAYTMEVFQPYH